MDSAIFPGESCFTAAEAKKLAARANVNWISGIWIYYCHLKSKDVKVKEQLSQLLPISGETLESFLEQKNDTSDIIYVEPRNISPWSSKATSISQVCGLSQVERIERGKVILVDFKGKSNDSNYLKEVLHDRMTERISNNIPDMSKMFNQGDPLPLEVIDLSAGESPLGILKDYNKQKGLSLDEAEMEYLVQTYKALGRSPRDIELFMFAQINSEHCRHKHFNAKWTIDGIKMDKSLFEMIKNTHKQNPQFTVSAYSDNAAVLEGQLASFWAPESITGSWQLTKEKVHFLAKVETHNHPTAISPFPGAATGSGGEIRDEGSVGRGSNPKAGLCGFWVSDLLIPGQHQPWEIDFGKPAHYASSLEIMLDAPIGSARFNNEFGRPCLTGCFRTLLTNVNSGSDMKELRGYHKPIMIAGGLGTVRPQHALKDGRFVKEGAHVIVLGGPAMLIGLGGGAASSNDSGETSVELDFSSVQRGNPEMERRAQMVINACVALGDDNPIALIHDVGAGGLSNALPELVKDAGFGGDFELRQIESSDSSMSPLQIWCCEAQERYVLIVNKDSLNSFIQIANRERCGFSDVGTVLPKDESGEAKLVLTDRISTEFPRPVELPMPMLFPKDRELKRDVKSVKTHLQPFDPRGSLVESYPRIPDYDLVRKAVERVFRLPSVGSKSFLITIGDRSVGGMTVRDQMVGPWQTPVADVGVTITSLDLGDLIKTGEAMSMGEKPLLALISPTASARMAVAESLMNLAAAQILGDLPRVKLSANWMVALAHHGEGASLYEAVNAIGMDLCPKLGISIPVGKDSTSMKASWKDPGTGDSKSVTAPLSVVISAFAPVSNVRNTWTPALKRNEDFGETILIYVDLANGHKALGGSALAQAFGQIGNEAPDLRDTDLLIDFYDAITQLHQSDIVLAYHDISDGGLITTIAEMMFAGRCGSEISIDSISESDSLDHILETLFNEELGAVFQVKKSDEINFNRCFATCGPPKGLIKKIGRVLPSNKQNLSIFYGKKQILDLERANLQQLWSTVSYQMQRLRDEMTCADEEFENVFDDSDPGIFYDLTFDPKDTILPLTSTITSLFTKAPKVAILREQGVNGHAEMAFAFKAAGFDSVDVHMSDIIGGRTLSDFVGIVACGGFSYGDVLGAGQGWASSILMHTEIVRPEFTRFFERPDTFTLGVCNGCQMLTRIKELIPGTDKWPLFLQNKSQQFEARLSMVKIQDNSKIPSVFFHGMHDSSLPIVVSHGEGRATFSHSEDIEALNADNLIPLRYVDNRGKVTTRYPFNANGSPQGIAGVRSLDGRVLAMMPHPERTIIADVVSYAPKSKMDEWGEFGPWVRMFRSARRWVG
ncbi:putative phosphoribosylformylglycinamidine synthase [Golovinomyces cichoracearum]|uniref:Phosphoribosylformylglycinamidine synthase n=1 Tax=Golovinomyces cichoracearum TaxID=62708 RepID=A0A420HTU2_9PEZI|nr:putative phosphoribosylformylglycinamidine synthase [Golovinomyces cichoracearum]